MKDHTLTLLRDGKLPRSGDVKLKADEKVEADEKVKVDLDATMGLTCKMDEEDEKKAKPDLDSATAFDGKHLLMRENEKVEVDPDVPMNLDEKSDGDGRARKARRATKKLSKRLVKEARRSNGNGRAR